MGVAAVPEAAAPSTLMNSIAAKLPHLSESHVCLFTLLASVDY